MKNIIVALIGISLITISLIYYLEKEEIPPCGYNKDIVISNFQDWLTNSIADVDKRIEQNPIKVIDVVGIMEYNQSPEFMNVPLYENLKDSRVCKATLLVDFTPNGKKRNLEEINVRFQKILTSPNEDSNRELYISVAGFDVKAMSEQSLTLFKKHNQK